MLGSTRSEVRQYGLARVINSTCYLLSHLYSLVEAGANTAWYSQSHSVHNVRFYCLWETFNATWWQQEQNEVQKRWNNYLKGMQKEKHILRTIKWVGESINVSNNNSYYYYNIIIIIININNNNSNSNNTMLIVKASPDRQWLKQYSNYVYFRTS